MKGFHMQIFFNKLLVTVDYVCILTWLQFILMYMQSELSPSVSSSTGTASGTQGVRDPEEERRLLQADECCRLPLGCTNVGEWHPGGAACVLLA